MKVDATRDSQSSEPTEAPPARLALKPAEAARALGIGTQLLWQQTNAGVIPCVRIGRRVVYPVALLERWLIEEAEKKVTR